MLNTPEPDATAETVYRELLAHPGSRLADLRHKLKLSERELRDAFTRLDRLLDRLLDRVDADDAGRHPVTPEVWLDVLLLRQQAELAATQMRIDRDRHRAARLFAQLERQQFRSDESGISLLTGPQATSDFIVDLINRAEDTVLRIGTGGPQPTGGWRGVDQARTQRHEQREQIASTRTICPDSIREDPVALLHAQRFTTEGNEVRTLPSLFATMTICDRTVAVIKVADPAIVGAVVIRAQDLIEGLIALFETLWQSARPLREEADRFSPQQMVALRPLAEGGTDQVLASRLGVSPRTARRIAAGIMAKLDARSRFQAGMRAVQRGHLPVPPIPSENANAGRIGQSDDCR
jgi:DNA-binding CsgD family transcriptional regulator/sugar-specific transcriptional regulator TrmB